MDSIEMPTADPQSEPFGYVCHHCQKCCSHMRVQINPYEIARLARNRGLTTEKFRAAWTENGAGLALARTDSDACVFLGEEGCTVYADRPLVCRLYPLGRHITSDGAETFFHVGPLPQSRGEFTASGTIADFLVAQDAHVFMRAADEYFYWLCALRESMGDEPSDGASTSMLAGGGDGACDLLDIDTVIARHCTAAQVAEPTDIEARRELHLKILYQQLESIK